MKWNCLGWQGSILASLFSKPVMIDSITIVSELYNQKALDRALKNRFPRDENLMHDVTICQGKSKHDEFVKSDSLQSSPCSIIFSKFSLTEVSVEGRKEGCIKKHFGTIKSRVAICRKSCSERYLKVIQNISPTLIPDNVKHLLSGYKPRRYSELKRLSPWYEFRRKQFLDRISKWPKRDVEKLDSFIMSSPKIFLFKADSNEQGSDRFVCGLEKGRLQ